MKLYLDENGVIVIDGEKTVLLVVSKKNNPDASNKLIRNYLPKDKKIMFTGLNVLYSEDNENTKKSINKFLENGTLFENRD